MRLSFLVLLLLLILLVPVAGQEGWEDLKLPSLRQGLVLQPRLMSFHERVTLFWAGTWDQAPTPEVCFSNRNEKDDWTDTRSPFFGTDLGRVRRLDASTARDMAAVIFQRQPSQGGGAMEVLMALSSDRGWSLGTPVLMDSYVVDSSLGTCVTVGARQGTKRPEFAAAWVAEDGAVRAASVDTRSTFRPQAVPVGHLKSGADTVVLTGSGRDGFYMVWAEDKGLKTSQIRPLTGGAQPSRSLLGGNYLNNFSMCSHYKGPANVVAIDETGKLTWLVEDGDKFDTRGQTTLGLKRRKMRSRSALDGARMVHVAIVNGDKPTGLYYTTNRVGKTFSAPEKVVDLDPSVPCTGFDITVSDNYVWIVVTQGQWAHFKRKKLPEG